MRILHFYPFVPATRHGGTLRLAAALSGTAREADTELHYFDSETKRWHGPFDLDLDRSGDPRQSQSGSRSDTLKRRIFPSTLWESGRLAGRALPEYLEGLDPTLGSTVLFLHTTYLAPVLRRLSGESVRTVVDAYDLVWRAHLNDAGAARGGLRVARWAYAASVRPRELTALRRAGTVLVAGYDDHAALSGEIADARWLPTPVPLTASAAARTDSTKLRVGMLGNFAHASTIGSAKQILASKLVDDPQLTVVLAGWGSERFAGEPVSVLGAVSRPEEFYAQIDCVIAPVAGGSGIKCKLGEALEAGRPVLTTALGASGYPPLLRRHFCVGEPEDLDGAKVRLAISEFDAGLARADADRVLGWDTVTAEYARSVRVET